MPLRNRVDPSGALHAVFERGQYFGNRGCLHDAAGRIVRSAPVKRWIICRTAFKGRRRKLLQPGRYTELFFCDEVTALAAGHRPCFECRRDAALAFSRALATARGTGHLTADAIDRLLDADRRSAPFDPSRRIEPDRIAGLPDGAMIRQAERYFAIRDRGLLEWSFAGYGPPQPARSLAGLPVHLVTPRATLGALAAGYRPRFRDDPPE